MTYEWPFHMELYTYTYVHCCIWIERRLKSNFWKSMLMNTILLFQLISTHLEYFMWKIHSEIWLILISRICGNKCIHTGNWKRWWTSSKSTDDTTMRITSMWFIYLLKLTHWIKLWQISMNKLQAFCDSKKKYEWKFRLLWIYEY